MHEQDQEHTFSIIGQTLLHMQSFERALNFTTTLVFSGEESLDLKMYERVKERQSKLTLGKFISMLRERASLHPEFEKLLLDVLKDRNAFIHNCDAIPGWDIYTDAGLATINAFCLSLIKRAFVVQEMLMALHTEWARQVGISPPTDAEVQTYVDSVDKKYGGYILDVFNHRPPPASGGDADDTA
ncbi:hypothetical protein [Hydrogenophaga sp.]